MDGWIKLHRSITEHWIWQDPIKLKWWLDILMFANHEDKKVNIGMQLVDCKRGQCVISLLNWGKRWGVSKHTVHNFFTLLKNDNMITTENLTKTTRITICNYETYQETIHAKGTQREQSGNESGMNQERNGNDTGTSRDTTKNDKNIKNDNNFKNKERVETVKRFTPPSIEEVQSYISEKEYSVDAESFVAFYTSKNWFVGKNKMKDWHAAIVTWEKRNNDFPTKKQTTTKNVNDIWGK